MLSKADIEAKRARLASLNKEALRLQGELDAHRVMRLNNVPSWIEDMVFGLAKEHGVSAKEIVKHGRSQSVVRARNELFYAVKATRPEFSFPKIASWFGFDHTTIIHSVAKHAADTGLPALTAYSLDVVRARNAETSRRMRQAAVLQPDISG